MTRFIDWNGTGNIDSQDIATSVAYDVAEHESKNDDGIGDDGHMASASNAGCLTAAIPIILLLLSSCILCL
jgi:hypothetical protein